MSEPRYAPVDDVGGDVERCLDCGSLVLTIDKPTHGRFHSILGGHAWALAVLKTAHLAAHVHDRYEVVGKIDSKRFDSWSGEAMAEVVASLSDAEHQGDDGDNGPVVDV